MSVLDELCDYIKESMNADKVDSANTLDFDRDSLAIRVIWRDKPKTVVGIKSDGDFILSIPRDKLIEMLCAIKIKHRKMWIEDWTDRLV